uniref:Secreted protein n=1 Tax=Picea sitchensis TaxID=3332 RepID=A9NP59_PICSI|nr:unknown [Picea sitchensis]
MRWGMVKMYLWRTTASAAPTASAVLAPATPDSIQLLQLVSDKSTISYYMYVHRTQWMVVQCNRS